MAYEFSDLPREYQPRAHGHVVPNPDGSLARCGGPGLCSTCLLEDRYLQLLENYRQATREIHR